MDVSRETLDRLACLAQLVRKWSATINLVGNRDLNDLERRHVADSLQVARHACDGRTWCDLGSGGGFPGLVVAIARPDLSVTLIESDQRKAAFLKSASRELSIACTVIAERIEAAPEQTADHVSARALAPLRKLLPLAQRHGTDATKYIFPKGARFRDELAEAQAEWRFDVDVRPSATDKEAVILILENLARV